MSTLLEIKLGSTNNLDLLPKIGKLRYLELGRIRQLTDLSCLGKLSEIRFLFLKTLNKLEALPSFSELSKLRWLYIESLRGLRDLTPISEAPALEQIICIDMPQLNPADFCVFKGHPTLKRAHIGLCSFAKNAQASKLLSLPTTHKMDGERLLQHKTIYSETGEDILR